MYSPQSDELDFEIGFGGRLKKAFRGGAKVLNKVTDATITKPSMAIGGAIGGKRGRALGKKLGGFTSTVTKLGVGAGVAGAALPLLGTGIPATIAGGMAAKKLLAKKRKAKAKVKARKAKARKAKAARCPKPRKPKSCNNKLAAGVAAKLAKSIGGSLRSANKKLAYAALQRAATNEHQTLMTAEDFRKKVLGAIASGAVGGNADCQKTIRVLVGR